MTHRLPLAAGVLAVGLLLTACGDGTGTASSNAATVNGTRISDNDFRDLLAAYEGNADFQATQAAGDGLQGPAEGTVNMDFARTVLNREIVFTLVGQEAAARGLDVEGQDEAAVRAFAENQYGAAVFASFSESFQERVLDQAAAVVALLDDLGATAPSTDQVQAAIDAEPERWESLCASHILVATEEEAQAVLDRLEAGEEFATVAEEVSIDTGSGAQGGSLNPDGTCVATSSYVPEFVAGARAATPGEPSAPVQSQFGYHVILVERFDTLPPEQVATVLQQEGQQSVNDWLQQANQGDIWVNAQYGQWDAASGSIVPLDAPGSSQTTSAPAG